MKNLLLITACLRHKNLYKIADSIASASSHFDFHITWLIVFDKYNCKITQNEKDDLSKYLTNLNIDFIFEERGDEGKPNYGGTMFNEPLRIMKETVFKDINPYVYIMDDDNIFHPFLLYALKNADEKNFPEDKILVLTKVGKYGEVGEAYEDILMKRVYYDKNGVTYWRIPIPVFIDPSQAIFRLDDFFTWDYYAESGEHIVGKITERSEYDCDLVSLYDRFPEKFITFEKYLFDGYYDSYRTCFHNGLRTDEEIEHYNTELKDSNIISSYVFFESEKLRPMIFPVTDELAKQIMELIKNNGQP